MRKTFVLCQKILETGYMGIGPRCRIPLLWSNMYLITMNFILWVWYSWATVEGIASIRNYIHTLCACNYSSMHYTYTTLLYYYTMHWFISYLSVKRPLKHYNGVIMSAMASKTTGVSIVYSTICSNVDQRKHQSSVSLAFVRGIYRWPVISPQRGPVTRKMFPFDDVIMSELKLPAGRVTWWYSIQGYNWFSSIQFIL